jgi:putative FmdB family regulatory protein
MTVIHIYIYFCDSCKCRFEVQKDSEDCSVSVTKCPKCGSESTRQVYHSLGGFYSTSDKPATEVKS